MADLINQDHVNQITSSILKDIAIKGLSDGLKNKLQRIISNGIVSGLAVKELIKDITKTFGSSFFDAERIARTETHRVTEAMHYEVFKDAKDQGVDIKRRLIATLDNRTRAQSAQMDGQFSNEDGKFKYPDGNYYIPGDPAMPAKWSINDRERSVDVIDGFSAPIRRTREDGIIPFITYKEWAKEKGLTKNIYGEVLFQ